MSRRDIVVEPISARIALNFPAISFAASETWSLQMTFTRSTCSATAEIRDIK